MGNYIYGHITPKNTSSNQSVTINTTDITSVVEDTPILDIKEEKSIHPYLLEYGTGVSNHMIINNNVYKYTKPN